MCFVQSTEEPVARAVACEDTPDAITAMGPGCQAENKQAGAGITKRRHGPAPVLLILETPHLLPRHTFTPLHQPLAQPAVDDLVLNGLKVTLHEKGGKFLHIYYLRPGTSIKTAMPPYEINPFACAMCGNCCRGEGYVRVTPQDVAAIAAHLQMGVAEFTQTFTRPPEYPDHAAVGDLWLLDKPGPELECIFLEGNFCRVHESKPGQCIGFPMKWRTPDIMDYCVGMQS